MFMGIFIIIKFISRLPQFYEYYSTSVVGVLNLSLSSSLNPELRVGPTLALGIARDGLAGRLVRGAGWRLGAWLPRDPVDPKWSCQGWEELRIDWLDWRELGCLCNDNDDNNNNNDNINIINYNNHNNTTTTKIITTCCRVRLDIPDLTVPWSIIKLCLIFGGRRAILTP